MTDYRIDPMDDRPTHQESARRAVLEVVSLAREAAAVTQEYENFVVLPVNDHRVRLAVMTGEFRWHRHPRSDECFLVLEGELEIDLRDRPTVLLRPGEAFSIPAGTSHRTRSRERAVNLCFERRDAYTDMVFEDGAP